MTDDEWERIGDELLAESVALNGCDRIRRYCCSYHAGFEDAIDLLLGKMEGKENG